MDWEGGEEGWGVEGWGERGWGGVEGWGGGKEGMNDSSKGVAT